MIATNTLSRTFAVWFGLAFLAVVVDQTRCQAQPNDQDPTSPSRAIAARSPQWNSNVLIRQLALAVGHPKVIEELKILRYQVDQLKQLQYDFQAEITETAKQYARTKPAERDAGLAKLYDKTREDLDSILLPEQVKRLEQIAVQSLGPMQSADDGMALANLLQVPVIKSELDITRDNLEKIQEAAKEQSELLRKRIAELKAEANRKVLESIDPELRQRISQLVGDPFDFDGYELGRGGVFRRSDDH